MNSTQRWALAALLSVAGLAGAVSDAKAKGCGASEPARSSLVDSIRDGQDMVTFYMLLRKSGLESTLRGSSYTVFAPTDQAFQRLSKERLAELEGDPAKLRGVLMYHMAAGRYFRQNLEQMRSLNSISGHSLALQGRAGSVGVNEATMTKTSVQASNGMIHLLDTVMWPPGNIAEIPNAKPPPDVVEVLKKNGKYTTLLAGLEKTGLATRLRGGAFTLFAPTDEAFAKDPGLAADAKRLEAVLSYHITRSRIESKDVNGIILHTQSLDGKTVYIKGVGGTTVNDAAVSVPDMRAGEGVIHGIDKVLQPGYTDDRSAFRR